MTGLAYAPSLASAPPLTAWRLLLAGASVFLLLVYSQAWVFPLMGPQADVSQGGLIRALYLPAYAAGFLLLTVSPGATFQALLRQPFLVALMLLVAASTLWSIARTRPCDGCSPPIARRSAAWCWPHG